MTEQYQNNPLHGLKLEQLLTELVDHYGWEILAAALNFNCFKLNPTLKGSAKFLKKTDWARQKLEIFYLYKFKNLPRPDKTQFELPPRDRIVPEHQSPREPVELTLESLIKDQETKEEQAKNWSLNKRKGGDSRSRGSRSHDSKSANFRPYNSRPDSSSSEGNRSDSSQSSKPSERANTSTEETFDPWGAAKKKLSENPPKD